MPKTIQVTLIAMIFLASTQNDLMAQHTTDSLAKVQQNLDEDKAVLVDVREKIECDAGCVEGAVRLPLSDLKNGIDQQELNKRLPKGKIVYTYCAAGVRSVMAGTILKQHDLDVRPLKEGYTDLLEAGFKKADD
jgi:phage shock protein E